MSLLLRSAIAARVELGNVLAALDVTPDTDVWRIVSERTREAGDLGDLSPPELAEELLDLLKVQHTLIRVSSMMSDAYHRKDIQGSLAMILGIGIRSVPRPRCPRCTEDAETFFTRRGCVCMNCYLATVREEGEN